MKQFPSILLLLLSSIYFQTIFGINPFGKEWLRKERIQQYDDYYYIGDDNFNFTGLVGGNFSQKVDHFDLTNNDTFLQQYFINPKYWDGIGPIIYLMGSEEAAGFEDVGYGFMGNLVEAVNGLAITLEHRFYGRSNPKKDLSTDNLQYLTVEQSLEDYAYFRNQAPMFLSKILSVNESAFTDNAWIAVGCSYSGALAAFFRMKYPSISDAAVASSACVEAVLGYGKYDQILAQSLEIQSPECLNQTQEAVAEMESFVANSTGLDYLSQLFSTCLPLNSSDIARFQDVILGPITTVVQYNLATQGYPRKHFCETMTNTTSSALETYAEFVSMYYGGGCISLDFGYDIIQPPNWGRSWFWQQCSQYGLFQVTPPGNEKIGGSYVTLEYYKDWCTELFGEDVWPDTSLMNMRYSGNETTMATNIFFNAGYEDPWIGVQNINPEPPMFNEMWSGEGHCAVWMHEVGNASPSVTEIQNDIIDYVLKIQQSK